MSTPQDPQRPYDPSDGSTTQGPYVHDGQAYDPNAAASCWPTPGPPSSGQSQQPVDPYGSAGSAGPGAGGYNQGQPGYPQNQGGYPQNQAGYQPEVPAGFQQTPPTPPANNKQRNIIIAVAVVIAVALAGFFIYQSQTKDTKNASVGACINVIKADPTNAKTEQIACSDPKATYVVTETGKSLTCDKNEATYTQGDTNVCLRPNLKVGECAKVGAQATNGDFEKVDCAKASSSNVKLDKLSMTSSAASQCAQGEVPLDLPKRNIVYCFGPAKG